MAPSKAPTSWDDEESEGSTPPSSPPVITRRSKFDDEEDDADVLDDWDAAEDSEVEREKAKKTAEAKAKAEAEAKANHKSKSQRIEEKRAEAARRRQLDELDAEDSEEDEAAKRARIRAAEKENDLKVAEDMLGGMDNIGVSDKRGAVKPVTIQESEDPADAIDLSKLKLFNPTTPAQFMKLRETIVPLLTANSKKPQYAIMMPELVKQLTAELNSEQMRKVATAVTTQSNEKMKAEKAQEKGGKKTKAAKTKGVLNADKGMANRADTTAYDDDGLGE
ncbi:hypothetical protein MBLNU230_g6100t1 [Neophaeotheca triangularis]